MIPICVTILFTKSLIFQRNPKLFRCVRSIARRESDSKLIKGKVKTTTEYDDSPQMESYKDFIQNIKKSNLGDELEVEKQFLNEDYHGDAFEKCEMYYDMHVSEEKNRKSLIKKNIVGRKYFKLDRETNLLTHAAKQQIRFLHQSNPLEWNCKSLSECFPVSEAGVKKLLRSNFVQTCPEKIKVHDEEVAKKWEILKSGKFTDKVAPLTLKLYKEGKLVDDYSSGNPNLPTAPPPSTQIIEIKKQEVGEFSSIVQSYVDYQKQKLIEKSEENSSDKQVALKNTDVNINIIKKNDFKNLKKYKYASEELEDENADPEVGIRRRKKYTNNDDIPFSQFKEMLKEETILKKSKYKNEYDDFVMQETSKSENNTSLKKPQHAQNCFVKIPKYEKENVSLKYEKTKNVNSMYKYDEKLGYQHPVGKDIKGKMQAHPMQYQKGKLHKVGQCVYDDNGDFLYKIPS